MKRVSLTILLAIFALTLCAQAKPSVGGPVPSGTPGKKTAANPAVSADEAYNEVIGWSLGYNDAKARAQHTAQIDAIYERLERASYRFGIIPEFAMAVVTCEAYFSPQTSYARSESWSLYEQNTNYKMKRYPIVLDDMDTALSTLAVAMKQASTVDQVLTLYWSGPNKQVNADSLELYKQCVNKIYNGLEVYARARKQAERQGSVKPNSYNSYNEIFDSYSGWGAGANDNMDGFKSHITRPLSPGELRVFKGYEEAYAAKAQRFNKNLSDREALEIARAVLTYCGQTDFQVDPRLVMAVVAAESAFRPRAVSQAGALGLGQLMPATARGLGVSKPFDPCQNLYGCVKYIEREQHRWRKSDNRNKLVLAAYNAGPGAVQKYNGVPPYNETRAYVNTVMKYYRQFSN